MKMKVDLSKFKLKERNDDTATLLHPDGHEFKVAIKALHPGNRKNLDELEMAEGGEVKDPKKGPLLDEDKVKKFQDNSIFKPGKSIAKMAKGGKVEVEAINKVDAEPIKPLEIERIPEKKLEIEPIHPVDYEPIKKAEGGEIPSAMPEQPIDANPQVAPAQAPAVLTTPAQPPVQGPEQAANPQPDLMHAYQQQAQGLAGQAEAQAQEAQGQEKALTSQLGHVQDLMQRYQNHFNELDQERKAFQDDINNRHIEPQRFLGSMDSDRKFDTAVGLLLGGLGGGGQGNAALDFLNKQIDRDIDSQRAELSKKENLLSANMRQFGNLDQATQMTRIMMTDMLANKLKMAEAKAQNPLAKARAQQALGQLEAQIAPMAQQLATRRMLEEANGTTQQPGQQAAHGKLAADPASFVPSLVPEAHQEAVFKELETAQNSRQVAKTALENFDAVAKEMQSAGGLGRLKTKIYAPAELEALEAELGTTVGEKEGTVRETAMHNVKSAYLPRASDTPEKLMERRKQLANYLKLKSAAPRAKSYGIDLDKFQSTARSDLGQKQLSPQEQKFADWAKANPNDPRAALVLKKLGIK